MTMTLVVIIIYFIRILILGTAIGTAFTQLNLFKKLSIGLTMLLGIASAPMFISLVDYLLGLVFIGWSSWFYFIVPTFLSLIYLFAKRNYQTAKIAFLNISAYLTEYIKILGEWVLLDVIISVGIILYFSIIYNGIYPVTYVSEIHHSLNRVGIITEAFFIVFILVCVVCIVYKMNKNSTLEKNLYLVAIIVVVGTASTHALSMIGRPIIDPDRAHYELDARYFLEDKNSWEIDNYSDEKYGSTLTDDHGPLWVLFLADADIVAEVVGMNDPVKCVNFALLWTYLCFYLFVFLGATFVGETYRTGVISLILFNIYYYTIFEITGSRDAFRFVGLMLLVMYVINQYDDIAEGKSPWYSYFMMFLCCFLSMNGHEGNVYIMLGMFIVFAIMLLARGTPLKHLLACGISVISGTFLGITKTIRIYLTTGRIKSVTLLPFHDTAVIDQIAEINTNRANLSTIWTTYFSSVRCVIFLGLIGLVLMLITGCKEKNDKKLSCSLIIAGMLLPMTGIFDWMGWQVSLWFAEQLRYRMYFLMLFSITGAWVITRRTKIKPIMVVSALVCLVSFGVFLRIEFSRCKNYNKEYVRECMNIIESYEKMADIISSLTNGDVFTSDEVLLYYLHGTPKLLYHPYAEDLIQARTDEEIEEAIEKMNIGAILLPKNGLDYHDYSLLPFWAYINEHFSSITPEEGGYSSNKIIFYK